MTEFNFDTSYYFSSLDNLNKECKNYTDSEAKYKELRIKYENEIYNKALEDYCNVLKKCWLNGTVANRIIKEQIAEIEKLRKGIE